MDTPSQMFPPNGRNRETAAWSTNVPGAGETPADSTKHGLYNIVRTLPAEEASPLSEAIPLVNQPSNQLNHGPRNPAGPLEHRNGHNTVLLHCF